MSPSIASPAASTELTVRRMERSDWGWVQRWYEDEVLDRELGPLDEEWLRFVLADTDGVQLVVEELTDEGVRAQVALVGVSWGGEAHGGDALPHGITDIAIDPARRRSALGRRALRAVCDWDGHPPAGDWVAFVDQGNTAAHAFFTGIGWRYEGLDGDAGDAMHRFRRPQPSGPGVGVS